MENIIIKTTILLCGPSLSAIGGGPTHMKNLLVSPLIDRYRLIHFESGSRGTESPAKDEKKYAMVFRVITSPFVFVWKIICSRPAVVHINSALDYKAFWRDLVYLLISKLLWRKVVFQIHGGSLKELSAGRLMRRAVRVAFSIPDAIVLLAAVDMRDFAKLGISDRVFHIPNGVDVSLYRGPAERVHSGKVQRLAYLGRLVREKGIFEAIEAIGVLRTDGRFSDIELRIAGSGPAQDEIERYIDDHKLGDCVQLVGSIFGSEKVEFLRQADVFVFPSYQEGLPYAILESLAAGTPIIASRVGGIPDVVIDRVHGILINPKDPGEIIRAVNALLHSEDALRTMSRNCVEWASQKLGLERLAIQFEELYAKICTR